MGNSFVISSNTDINILGVCSSCDETALNFFVYSENSNSIINQVNYQNGIEKLGKKFYNNSSS